MTLIGEAGPEWQAAFGGQERAAPGANLHQETLPDFILIRTEDVDEGDRLRPVDPVWAKALGRMMARDGQDTPIQVCRLPGRNRWTLVAGAHRLFGARDADIEHLRAEVVSADRDARRLREVRENLWRSDLTPIDRAAFIAEAVAIYKRRAGIDPARDGRVASVAARWQKQVAEEAGDTTATIASVYGWSETVGDQIGLSARTVRDDLMLYRRLPASVVERLREARHPVLSNASQLRALAKLEPLQQVSVVATLVGTAVNGRTITSVAQAVALGRGAKPAPDPEAKRLSAFIGAFSRMGLAEKKGALAQLASALPAGIRLVDGPEPAPRAEFPPQHVKYREEALAAIDTMRELVDGLLEDEVVKDDRSDELYRASGNLQITRVTIAGNGFELGDGAPVPVDAVARDILEDAVGFIAEQLGQARDADWIVGELSRRYEARSRFANGTYELRLGKVTATSTAGGLNLLRAWVAKARKVGAA